MKLHRSRRTSPDRKHTNGNSPNLAMGALLIISILYAATIL